MVAPTSVKGASGSCSVRGVRPVAGHDVDAEVLHRGVEVLLDDRREAVDLVDEEDVAALELREQRGELALVLDRRARARS